jgi:hypothetical protein
MVIDLEEDLLSDILGLFLVANYAVNQAVYPVHMALYENLKTSGITG